MLMQWRLYWKMLSNYKNRCRRRWLWRKKRKGLFWYDKNIPTNTTVVQVTFILIWCIENQFIWLSILTLLFIFFKDGNGKCVIKQNVKDCNERGSGHCKCPLLKRRSIFEDFGGSTFEGKFCECCTAGECQKHCFSRFTKGKENNEMCSSNGTCDCKKGGAWNKDQKQGKKCKVKFFLKVLWKRTIIWNLVRKHNYTIIISK